MNLKEFNDGYITKANGWSKRRDKIQKQIHQLQDEVIKLQEKQERLKYPQLREVFKPLLEEIRKRLKAESVEKYGAFGMCNETSFYFKKNKDECITKKGNVLGNLTLISFNDGWAIRNERKKVNDYPKNSIAEMNGMNYETIEITEKMNLNWLVKFCKKGAEE